MRIFKEEQRFTQTWLVVVMLMSTLVPLSIIIHEFTKEKSTMTVNELFLVMTIMLVAVVPIFFFKLYTRIDEKGVHYRFFPIHFNYKSVYWNELEKCFVRKYDPISEYGGWGFKGGALWKKSNGKAINVSGEIGIQLYFKNGKKLLIGTQKEADANSVLKTYLDKIET